MTIAYKGGLWDENTFVEPARQHGVKYRVHTKDDGNDGTLPVLYDTVIEANQAGRSWRRDWDKKTEDWQPDGEWHSADYCVWPERVG